MSKLILLIAIVTSFDGTEMTTQTEIAPNMIQCELRAEVLHESEYVRYAECVEVELPNSRV